MPIGEHTPHPHESQPEILSDYAQSTDQLLGLLSTAHNRTHYYTVSWDREVPGRVADITLMRATSTGAHREERFGQFHQAQMATGHNGSSPGVVPVPTKPGHESDLTRRAGKVVAITKK
jgi:hypothetical protein